MTTTYDPSRTRYWSTRELADLIGKTVAISFRPDGVGPLSGRVVDAGIGRFGEAWIEVEGGGSVTWNRAEISATITVES
jgi:hypothetical protein